MPACSWRDIPFQNVSRIQGHSFSTDIFDKGFDGWNQKVSAGVISNNYQNSTSDLRLTIVGDLKCLNQRRTYYLVLKDDKTGIDIIEHINRNCVYIPDGSVIQFQTTTVDLTYSSA